MEVIKVLYNRTYGGFELPKKFCKEFNSKYGEKLSPYTIRRDDERIIEMVEASDWFKDSDIAIEEIPVGCEYTIHEYDGLEHVTWSLPESTIIEDLRKLLVKEVTDDDIHPLTKHFLEFGGSYKEFESYFRKKFKHPDHA